MAMTEEEKYIHNIRYVIGMLEDKRFTRKEIIQILKDEVERTIRISENRSK